MCAHNHLVDLCLFRKTGHCPQPLSDLPQARLIRTQAQSLLGSQVSATPQPGNGRQVVGRHRRQR